MFIKLENFLTEVVEKTTENNQYPILTSSKSGLSLQSDYFNKQVASKDNTGYKIIRRGQFSYRAMSDTGKFFPNMLECVDIGIVSPAYPVFKITDSNMIDAMYLKYFFKSARFQQSISTFAHGSTRTSIKFDQLKTVPIDLPSMTVQRQVVANLDKLQSIITHLKQQLEKLDLLVKSRFVEMFGTIANNPYHFPTTTLKEVCNKITDGKHGGCEIETDSGYYYVGAREIYDGCIHYDTAPQISYADFAKGYKRCNIEQGDVVIVNTGATIGKTAIAKSPQTERTLLQKSVALLKVKSEVINIEFLRHCYMVNPSMYKVESASAQPNLLLSKMNATRIYLPPLDLQEQFATFVEQTDKSKLAVKQVLEKAETLKKALMQEYFG